MTRRTGFVSIEGKAFGINHADQLAGQGTQTAGLAGIVVGGGADGTDYVEAHGPLLRSTMFDDFLGKTISIQWGLTKGSDGSAVSFAHSVNLGGMARGTIGSNVGASMATNGIQIDDGILNWQANKGDLVMEASIKTDALTSRAIFVGFTDQVASLEMPFTLSAGVLTSNATDAVGFLFDTAATAATLKLVSVANDVDGTTQDLGIAVLSTAYAKLRVELDASGNATFYVNGVQVGTKVAGQFYNMAAAVRPTIPLTPVVAAFSRTTATGTVDLDWLRAQQKR